MSRSFLSFLMCSFLVACGGGGSGAQAHDEATTGDETAVVASETPVIASDTPAVPQPEEGSAECAGCAYSSSPGYPGPSGSGGIAEWCMSAVEGAERTCAMSCCRSARGR